MPFIQLFLMFFRIGIFSFGGGYAMLPLIFQGVQEFGIMTSAEFSRLVALSQVTPGPIAVNAATYVGFQYTGFFGAFAATFGVALPSVILVILTMHFMKKFQESKGLEAVLFGIRPATVGLIASAVIFLSENSLFQGPLFSKELIENIKEYVNLLPCILFICTIILAGKFRIGPIKLTILAGLVGAFLIR
ncbi:chromate transporter [Sinanaerobacter chloroacetimidivorans]|jgi:chromate transporter|uniref:Chromate transporter n=1 Tax=Sinanaerobacter chloroacetimidivorans TaxID=2818044 RepID=A0A8J7W7J9_9FIRM|nr:chromate transporter [Sinanaerobacter chloroacetimidivorans]MBR0600468.1 chromate transporter [Sinanaerobacter chloroacetimidivorans]